MLIIIFIVHTNKPLMCSSKYDWYLMTPTMWVTMFKRFFKANNFRMHISKQKIYQETYLLIFRRSESRPAGAVWADKIVILARKSSRRGLSGRQNRILSEKVIPQGPFFRQTTVNHILSQKVVPQGGFWATYFISCESKVACKCSEKKKSQNDLNHILLS